MSQNLQYNEESIQILEGLDAVRKRPGMYIGSTDSRGLHHLVFEIVDNAIDEALQGFGDTIIVTINKDNSITVSDKGRGIPTGMHKSGKPTPEVIFTVLHAGGKFGGSGYKTSGGLHGVGSSVVNALSEWFVVEIKRDGKIYTQRFENGGKPKQKLKVIGKTKETGTTVHFKPDTKVFSMIKYKFDTLAERLRESAFLLKGLTLILRDEQSDKEEVFCYEDGLISFVEFLNEGREQIHEPVFFEGEHEDIEVEFALQYTKSYSEHFYSFVNNVRTKDGGTHETGSKMAITRVFNEFARKLTLLKEKEKNLEGADIREGLTAIVSVRIPEKLLQFEGQTKNKLGTSEARQAVEAVLSEKLSFYLSKYRDFTESIIKKAVDAAHAREAARKARELARTSKKRDKAVKNLNGKLTPAQSKDRKKNELFIVEGISAGGSAKQGRNKKYQAILPLKGKVINTEKAKMDDIFKNDEINNMIYAIGGGFGTDFDIEKINYDKIIIMTDADTDGAHIQVLLLTFFFRYMTRLVENGKVFIALPPLYKYSRKRKFLYLWSDQELKEMIKKDGPGYSIQRYKGLGEMNADQLFDTTMDPEKRKLIQVSIDSAAEADHYFSIIMGDQVDLRREWIEENVSFTLEDDFDIERVNK